MSADDRATHTPDANIPNATTPSATTPNATTPLGSSARNQWHVNKAHCDLTRVPRRIKPVFLAALPQNITIDLARTAVVVVDMQNDFCHPAGWLGSIGVDTAPARQPIAPLAAVLPQLRRAGVPVVWLNWGNRPDKLNLSPSLLHVYNGDGQSAGLGDVLPGAAAMPGTPDAFHAAKNQGVLQVNSWGAAVADGLTQASTDIRIDKFRMSGFYDTCLDAVLRNLDISTLLFAGVNADQCVLATLMDANFLGYDCVLLEDCTATTSPHFCWQATLYNVRQCFGFTALSTVLCSALPDEF